MEISSQMISPIEYKDNPLRCPSDRPFACLLSLVIASVEAFPVEGDDQEIEDLASGFSPDSETLAITGIPKKWSLSKSSGSLYNLLKKVLL